MKNIMCVLLLLTSSSMAFAQSEHALWKVSSKTSTSNGIKKTNLPLKHLVDLDHSFLENILVDAPKRNAHITSNTTISLPAGEGKVEKFTVYDNPVMSPELAAKYPEIKSYFGVGIDNPKARVYFSYSPLGFKSMTLYADKSALFIEPVSDDLSTYTVYKRSEKNKSVDTFECNTKHDAPKK